jgi:uncharacterized protein
MNCLDSYVGKTINFMKKYLLLSFLSFTSVLSMQGYPASNVPHPKMTDVSNFVSNPDGILDDASVARINTILQLLEADTQAEVALVVLQTIEDDEIEDFAVRLFQEWGIGKKSIDNGLLILFVMDQRAIRFETGYGLEGVLPDAICKRIQMQTMIPAFKDGNYGAGLLRGIEQIVSLVRNEPTPELQKAKSLDGSDILLLVLMGYLFLALIPFLWISISIKNIKKNTCLRSNPERYFALQSKKKIVKSVMIVFLLFIGFVFLFFFFSTGSVFLTLLFPFTLIPANCLSKCQMRKFRRQPVTCQVCGAPMHILPEKEDNAYLSPAQDLEEKIRSMDYDVFLCRKCHRSVIFGYDRNSHYTQCPKCKTKAFGCTKSYTVVTPTVTTNGVMRSVYTCQFCNYTKNEDEATPRLQASVPGSLPRNSGFFGKSSSGNKSFGRGGSFGGGGSGGGGSTSRW